jgi:hypothetical protein
VPTHTHTHSFRKDITYEDDRHRKNENSSVGNEVGKPVRKKKNWVRKRELIKIFFPCFFLFFFYFIIDELSCNGQSF